VIASIHLHNFKAWSDQLVPFRALTLVTGLNGSGKSTLLQSLLILRQSHEQGLLASGRLAINGDLANLGTGKDAFCEHGDGDKIGIAIMWDDRSHAEYTFDYDSTSDVLDAKARFDIPERPPFGPGFVYLSAERIGPRVSSEVSEYRVRNRRELGSRGELAVQFLSVHGSTPVEIPSLQHANAASTSLLHQVEAWLSDVSPGTRLHVGEHRDLDAVQLRYSFTGTLGGSNAYRATNVGFGLSYTLPILVAILSARPGGLVLIENPEAHLHPRAQVYLARMLAVLAAADVQVVIETHSDHVLNGIRLAVHDGELASSAAQVHFFERSATPMGIRSVCTSPEIDNDGRLEPWPSGFFDELEISMSRLLEPGRRRS
jgi:predicted ATPase